MNAKHESLVNKNENTSKTLLTFPTHSAFPSFNFSPVIFWCLSFLFLFRLPLCCLPFGFYHFVLSLAMFFFAFAKI